MSAASANVGSRLVFSAPSDSRTSANTYQPTVHEIGASVPTYIGVYQSNGTTTTTDNTGSHRRRVDRQEHGGHADVNQPLGSALWLLLLLAPYISLRRRQHQCSAS